jgi:hypothetical protein
MTAERLRDLMQRHATALWDLTEQYMENKGNKSEDCQRICVRVGIQALEAKIAGIDDTDLKPGRRA